MAFAEACSGDMYSGVPMMEPARVSRFASGAPGPLAMPKSSTFTKSVPSFRRSTKTFSGFRSRWTMPRWWAAPSARQICRKMGTARASGMGPSRWRIRARLSPSSASMTK